MDWMICYEKDKEDKQVCRYAKREREREESVERQKKKINTIE